MGRTIKSYLNATTSKNIAINPRCTYPMILEPVEGPARVVTCARDVDLDLPSIARASHERGGGRDDR
jgi:hypothetical protein